MALMILSSLVDARVRSNSSLHASLKKVLAVGERGHSLIVNQNTEVRDQ